MTAPVRPPGQATPGRRPPARAIIAALAATVPVALAGLVLIALEWKSLATSDAICGVGAVAGSIAYAALGALIVRRAGNLVGWFMLAEGAASVVMITGSAYAIFGMKAHPGTLPAAAATGALAEAAFVLAATNLAALFLVFPTGRLPSPRWRPAALAGLGLTGLTLAAFVVSTRRVALPAPGGISLTYPNPLAVRSLQPVTRLGTLNGLALVFPLLLGGALVSLALRYRRGDQRLRQQMKWLGLAIAGVLASIVVGSLAIVVGQANKPLQTVPYAVTPFLVYFGIPAAMAIAILRRRLFDIDVIISRALLFTLLSAGVTAVYAAIVLGIGTFVGHRRRPAADRRRGGRHRAGVPAAAAAGQPAGQPPGLRRARHAVPGPVRLRRRHGGPARPGRRAGPDGLAAGRRGRRQPGRGVDPGRRRAAARRGLAGRFGPVGRGGAERRPASSRSSTPRPGWCRSGTAMTCSARSP